MGLVSGEVERNKTPAFQRNLVCGTVELDQGPWEAGQGCVNVSRTLVNGCFGSLKEGQSKEEPAQVSRSALLPPAEAPDQPFTGSLGYGRLRDPFYTLTSRRSTKHYRPLWLPVLMLKPEERDKGRRECAFCRGHAHTAWTTDHLADGTKNLERCNKWFLVCWAVA